MYTLSEIFFSVPDNFLSLILLPSSLYNIEFPLPKGEDENRSSS